jgi:hypothetical protein
MKLERALWHSLLTAPVILGASVGQAISVSASGAPRIISSHPTEPLVDEKQNGFVSPIPSVSNLADIHSTDWTFITLQSLAEQYGCVTNYPDTVYSELRSLSRSEFAVELGNCLQQIHRLGETASAEWLTDEELTSLQRLQDEFAVELATSDDRLDSLETDVAALATNQFAPLTQFRGEVNVVASDIFGGVDETNNAVLQSRVRLTFDTSFTGEDRLRVRLLFGNFERFSTIDDSGNPVLGNEGRLGISANTNSEISLGSLSYRFPIGEPIETRIYAKGGSIVSLVDSVSPFLSSGQGGVSQFGRYNPIYRVPGGTGIGTTIDFNDAIALQLGYLASEAEDAEAGAGLLNGNYGAVAQLTLTPADRIELGLTYLNAYAGGNRGNFTGTGSDRARVQVDRPVSINSYGLTANVEVTDGFEIGGWAGFSSVRAIGLGDAEVWNYALTLAFPDLAGEGNLGGLVIGMQPRLTGSTPELGAALERRRDPDVGLHLEGFYRYRLSDHISITPGVIWLTAPNHDNDNQDVIIGTIRTTFTF